MTKKPTKRDLFLRVFEVVAESDSPDKELLCDFISHEVTLYDKRKNAPKVPTDVQRLNETIKRSILETLTANPNGLRAGEIASIEGYSNQKVSALLRQLVIDNKVERVEDKKVVTFVKRG